MFTTTVDHRQPESVTSNRSNTPNVSSSLRITWINEAIEGKHELWRQSGSDYHSFVHGPSSTQTSKHSNERCLRVGQTLKASLPYLLYSHEEVYRRHYTIAKFFVDDALQAL